MNRRAPCATMQLRTAAGSPAVTGVDERRREMSARRAVLKTKSFARPRRGTAHFGPLTSGVLVYDAKSLCGGVCAKRTPSRATCASTQLDPSTRLAGCQPAPRRGRSEAEDALALRAWRAPPASRTAARSVDRRKALVVPPPSKLRVRDRNPKGGDPQGLREEHSDDLSPTPRSGGTPNPSVARRLFRSQKSVANQTDNPSIRYKLGGAAPGGERAALQLPALRPDRWRPRVLLRRAPH